MAWAEDHTASDEAKLDAKRKASGLGERPSAARYQGTDAEIRNLMSESGIGWPMSDRDEDEEPPPSHILKASRFATGQ